MVRIKDEEVLKHLEENARKPAAHIALALGVTETAIRKRIKKLEDNKTIKHYTIRCDPKKTGGVHAFIGVNTESDSFVNAMEFCKKHPSVVRAYMTVGNHTLQLKCTFADNDAFTAFVRALEAQPGVTKVCPGIITDMIK